MGTRKLRVYRDFVAPQSESQSNCLRHSKDGITWSVTEKTRPSTAGGTLAKGKNVSSGREVPLNEQATVPLVSIGFFFVELAQVVREFEKEEGVSPKEHQKEILN